MKAKQQSAFQRLNHLYWPMLGGGVAYSIMPFINTLMMGHLAPEVLAAGGLVNASFFFCMTIFWGIFTTLATLISRNNNAEHSQKINSLFKTAQILSVLLGILAASALWQLDSIFALFHQSQVIIDIARPYIKIISLVAIANLMVSVCEQYFFGLGKPRAVMVNAILMLFINVVLNYSLMYGKFGMPALGIEGLALGTLITSGVSFIVLSWIIRKYAPFKNHLISGFKFSKDAVIELLSNGLPVGLIWLMEVGFFATVAFLMGRISISALAAHELAFQADLLAFSLTVNLGQALQILIGEDIGQKCSQNIMPLYKAAFCFLSILIAIVALMTWCFPGFIIQSVLGGKNVINLEVVSIAKTLLIIMPIFLFFDSIGFLTLSALRGLKKTRVSLIIVILNYWIFWIPLLSSGVIHFHWFSPRDLWLGFCAAALISFSLQFTYFKSQLKRM